MKRHTIALLLASASSFAAAQPAQLGVSPMRFEIAIDGAGSTRSFRVYNYGKDSVDVELSVVNWDLDEQNAVRILPPSEQSLDQWVVLNPTRFTIGGGAMQTVRFAVRPRVEPEPGEHRCMIFIRQLKPDESVPLTRFFFRVGIAVYGHAGEVHRTAAVHGFEAEADRLRFDVSADGNAHVRLSGRYLVWSETEFPGPESSPLAEDIGAPEFELPAGAVQAGLLTAKPILPGTRRRVEATLDQAISPGRYVVQIDGMIGETAVRSAVPLEVPESPSRPSDSDD